MRHPLVQLVPLSWFYSWCLGFSPFIYSTMICVATLCRTSSSPLLKLNNTPIISPKLTSSNTNCDMILILIYRHTFNRSGNAPTWFSKCTWPHIERRHGIAFLWRCDSSWVGNHHCMQRSGTLRICFLLCSLTCSSFVILYLVRTICSLSGRGAGTSAVNNWESWPVRDR